jgi:Protein of unknown function (DUF2911)
MKKIKSNLLIATVILSALPTMAQRAPVSPHETITANIDGNEVKVVYGRPYSKKPGTEVVRKIWGELVPWSKAWRMGADQATLLTTAQPIAMGETTVPAGTYSLYLVPMETGTSKLAISKKTGQWGIPIDETQDLARVDVKKDSMDKKLDQFTMAIEKNPSGGGIIKMMWENTQFSVAFTVKK